MAQRPSVKFELYWTLLKRELKLILKYATILIVKKHALQKFSPQKSQGFPLNQFEPYKKPCNYYIDFFPIPCKVIKIFQFL